MPDARSDHAPTCGEIALVQHDVNERAWFKRRRWMRQRVPCTAWWRKCFAGAARVPEHGKRAQFSLERGLPSAPLASLVSSSALDYGTQPVEKLIPSVIERMRGVRDNGAVFCAPGWRP